jgi:glutamate 5-kinase
MQDAGQKILNLKQKKNMRVVIKLGTNLLTKADGSLDSARIRSLAGGIAKAKKEGAQVVVVSSGAIGAGMGKLKKSVRPSSLREKQALAAVGQPLLMDIYQDAFGANGIVTAQVLLTRHDFEDRQRYLNARNTLLTLLEHGIVPVINENDTTAVDEINFGDNDNLSAIVSVKICADLLIILTDVDGLYKGVPGRSELVSGVDRVTKEIERMALKTSGSGKGVGGMQSKIAAARTASSGGVKTVIANGQKKNVIKRIMEGKSAGTVFSAQKSVGARKCWIAFGVKCRGSIVIDDGAVDALKERKKSLLASGIVGVSGKFDAGDTISVVNRSGDEIGRGVSYYSCADIEKIKGKKTNEIKKVLKRAEYEEVVHRDNLVVL